MKEIVDYLAAERREPRIYGVIYATVSGIDNGEYMLQSSSGDITDQLGPARLATMMTGDKYGSFFAPVEGDEVVVGFELGDPARPVILGALWNPDRQPPDKADQSSDNNVRTLVSRNKHELTFDDSPSATRVTLKSNAGNELTFHDSSGATRVTLKSSAGYEVIIEDSPTPRIIVKTTGTVATSTLVLDGVMWNHQHATGVGPSGPPLSVNPAAPEALLPEDQ